MKERNKTLFQSRIKLGILVRFNPGAAKFECIIMNMVMSPARLEDFATRGDERQFICALVGPSVMTDAYDLFMAKQDIYSVKNIAAEVLIEYDMATRFYYMDI
jgi:hypothetical protein